MAEPGPLDGRDGATMRRMHGPARVWSALLPCPGCGRTSAGELGACRRCWSAVDAVAQRRSDHGPGDTARVTLGPYRGHLGRLIRAAKYRPSSALLDGLGLRLGARVAQQWPDRCWVVVPVPPSAARRRRRGVDHAQRLATGVAAALPAGRSMVPALARSRATPPQSRVPRALREANLRGAITALPAAVATLRGAAVLLVDDVSTSGATLRACRQVLLAAGAATVTTAVVARAD